MTVRWRGLDLELHADVYAPREDTDLLLEASEKVPLRAGARACDVGTGTGALALALGRRGARVAATDVNPAAARLARANAQRNGLAVDVLRASLLGPLRGPFDLVVFNAPYLPVAGELPGELARAWEGGPRGLGWAAGFLDGLVRCLAPEGQALVVVSSLGDPAAFAALGAAEGWVCGPVAQAKLPWERLEVVQVRRGNL